jgi:hypothetical protein
MDRGGALQEGSVAVGIVALHQCIRPECEDPALDGEELVDAPHGLDRDRRLLQLGQFEELAPAVSLMWSTT